MTRPEPLDINDVSRYQREPEPTKVVPVANEDHWRECSECQDFFEPEDSDLRWPDLCGRCVDRSLRSGGVR